MIPSRSRLVIGNCTNGHSVGRVKTGTATGNKRSWSHFLWKNIQQTMKSSSSSASNVTKKDWEQMCETLKKIPDKELNAVKPHVNDILPGAGNNRHTGNKLYTRLIDGNKKAFVLADAKGKHQIVLQVYNQIQGRFLEKGPEGLYFIKNKCDALKKIRKALSENNRMMIENLKKTGQIHSHRSLTRSLSRLFSKRARLAVSNDPTKKDTEELCNTLKSPTFEDVQSQAYDMSCKNETPIAVTKPEQNDIMPGAKYYLHPGNKFFVSLIKVHKKDYLLATEEAKRMDIINEVYDKVYHQTPRGRFLRTKREGLLSVGDKRYGLKVVKSALGENDDVIFQYLEKENPTGLKRLGLLENHKKVAPQEKSLEQDNQGGFLRCLSKQLSRLHLKD